MVAGRVSRLGLVLLGLLDREARAGYDLVKLFAETPMGHFSDSPGAIYPALKRLEALGLVTGADHDTDAGRRRRVYRVTDAGRERLLAWLRQPVTRAEMQRREGELALRFTFMDSRVPTEIVDAFLRSYETTAIEVADDLAAYLDAGRGTEHGRFTVDLGLRNYRAHVAWARDVRRERAWTLVRQEA